MGDKLVMHFFIFDNSSQHYSWFQVTATVGVKSRL